MLNLPDDINWYLYDKLYSYPTEVQDDCDPTFDEE
jgi:hypothetical protein